MTALLTRKTDSSSPAQPRVTRRSLAKQQTREKVLQAARQLFSERGYEAATIRDIASVAGMSTGAVFASFADKSELFDEIVNQDCAAMVQPMRIAAAAGATLQEALVALFAVAYQFQSRQIPLVQAGMSVSWTRSIDSARGLRESLQPILDLIDETLERGMQRGELSQNADRSLLSSLLWDVYLAGYRRAVFDGWTADELTSNLAMRLGLILKGAQG